MKHKSKKWMLQTKRADFRKISERFGISPVLARCIVNREVQEEEIGNYIQADWRQLHSPWLFKDMEKAVQILRGNREKLVAISSDFDCDGIFSAIILKKGLEKVGIRSEIYTPDRVAEGYGVNRRIVDEATEAGAEILLTCDNGIAANEEIRYAKEKGMTVIVTDHHEVQEELPPADAVVDHKQEDCGYPFKGLCGAGVAFQLIGALYEKEGISPDEREDLLEYAAIATVADVMELKGENRGLVKSGLRALEHTKNTGLRALLEVQELSGKELEAYHIGFILGPCFNAAGRIDTVTRAFELLEETIRLTSFEGVKAGTKINLERPLAANARLGGHFVSGHIDVRSKVEVFEQKGKNFYLKVAVPKEFSKYVVYKGSVAIDGISLTIAEANADSLAVWLIPHTLEVTNLSDCEAGKYVNLEFDLLAKYVEKIATGNRDKSPYQP